MTPDFRQEVPQIEEFIDWLCDHENQDGSHALRIQREALYNAYLKGKTTAAPEEQPIKDRLTAAFDAGVNAGSGWSDAWKELSVHEARRAFVASLEPQRGEESK